MPFFYDSELSGGKRRRKSPRMEGGKAKKAAKKSPKKSHRKSPKKSAHKKKTVSGWF